jgi:prophage regulatory protein
MCVEPGWLEKQSKIASEDISRWEPWMRKEAGLAPYSTDMPLVVRLRDVMKMLSISRSMVYSLVMSSDFPKPIQLGPRAIGWRHSEIMEWLQTRERVAIKEVNRASL